MPYRCTGAATIASKFLVDEGGLAGGDHPFTLYAALLTCREEHELRAFVKDLLADSEIKRAELRWKIAQTKLGRPQCGAREARRKYKASQDLVSRVFAALSKTSSGYRKAYLRLLQDRPDNNSNGLSRS